MTLIELAAILLLSAAAIAGAVWGGAAFGAAGYVVGFVAGGAALPLLVAMLGAADHRRVRGPRSLPLCKCGRRFDALLDDHCDEHGSIWRCSCGFRFVRRRERVLEVRPGRPLRPYMQWHSRRGWVPSSNGRPGHGGHH